jgi:hypothetical protein
MVELHDAEEVYAMGQHSMVLSNIHEDKASLGSHRRCEGRMVQTSVTQVTISDDFWQAIWDKFENHYYVVKVHMLKVVSVCGNDIFQMKNPRIVRVITFMVLNWIRWFKS